MQIKTLTYYDNEYQWQLSPVEFLPNLNLLVGISGVGKTKILQAISSLKAIANGASFNGISWNIHFIANNNLEYTWTGKFETKTATISISEDSEQDEPVKLMHEKLTDHNGKIIVERKNAEIFLNGHKTPKLSPFESIITLLEEEDQISPVKASLDQIIVTDQIILIDSDPSGRIWRLPVSIFKKFENASLLTLCESGLPIRIKLSILYKTFPAEFNKIKQIFMSIFPTISDLKIKAISDDQIPIGLSKILQEATNFSIREKGIDGWLDNISSGMLKTLMYISELYLAPENSLILIDEFENSLGINCLDSVTELFLENKKNQLMITSHHPYIINNISPAYWKIVTRKAGLVTVKNAEDFHISNSRQKAFIDLINVLENEADQEEE